MDAHEEASEQHGVPVHEVAAGPSRATLVSIGVAGVVVLSGVVALLVASDANWIFPVIVGAITIGFVAAVVRALRPEMAWDNPQLHLPSNNDLALGDSVIVRFRRRARLAATSTAQVTARLVVAERSDGPGDTHDQRAEVYRSGVPVVRHHVVDDTLEVDLRLDIPLSDAPPSMTVPGFEVVWRLHVDIQDDDPTTAPHSAEFPIVVAPAVARRLIDGGVAP